MIARLPLRWQAARQLARLAAPLALAALTALAATACSPAATPGGGTTSRTAAPDPASYDPYAQRGYEMSDRPTSEQIEIARAILADQADEAGVDDMHDGWPSEHLFELVTRAQTMRDEAEGRYGIGFDFVAGGWHAPEYGDGAWRVRVSPSEGPLAGQDFTLTYHELSRDGRWHIADDYLPELREQDVVAYLDGIVDSFSKCHQDLKLAWGYGSISGTSIDFDAVAPDASPKDLSDAIFPTIYLYVAPGSFDEDGFKELRDELIDQIKADKSQVSYTMCQPKALLPGDTDFNWTTASNALGYHDERWNYPYEGLRLSGSVFIDGTDNR